MLPNRCYFSAPTYAAEVKKKVQSNLLNTDTKGTAPIAAFQSPYYRGKDSMNFGISRTKRTARFREAGGSSYCSDKNLCRFCDHSCGWPNGDRNQGTE